MKLRLIQTQRCIAVVLMAAFIFLFIAATQDDAHAQTAIRKLGRGLANIGSCWFEVPSQMMDTAESEGGMAAWTYGLAKGVWMMGTRVVVGVYEVITFPIPIPKDYKPIIKEPEFLFGPRDFTDSTI